MEKETQVEKNPTTNRGRFLLWAATALASLTVLRHFIPTSRKKTETVKMLGEDGKLVEVDISLIKKKRGKITNDELQSWVKR